MTRTRERSLAAALALALAMARPAPAPHVSHGTYTVLHVSYTQAVQQRGEAAHARDRGSAARYACDASALWPSGPRRGGGGGENEGESERQGARQKTETRPSGAERPQRSRGERRRRRRTSGGGRRGRRTGGDVRSRRCGAEQTMCTADACLAAETVYRKRGEDVAQLA